MYDSKVARWFVQDPLSEKYYAQSQYNYCGGNPISTIDIEGAYLETLWDVASLVIGVKSLINNIFQGNTREALKDAGGIIVDCAAALLPVVPGGAGAALSTARAASNIVDAANDFNKIDNAVDTGKFVDKTKDISSASTKAVSNSNHYSVYTGMDIDGNVKYVGITGRDPKVRFNEHKNSGTNRAKLKYEVRNGQTGLSKTEARRQEQLLIDYYGLEKNGGQLYNKINSISPKKNGNNIGLYKIVMAKRVYTKKGDVYEIKIDETSKKYMQFIGSDWNQLNSDTFRVYKKNYPIEAVPSLEEILSDTPDFYVHCYAPGGIKDGLWSLAYRCKDVGDTSGIKFATYNDLELPEANIYRGWRLWYFAEPITETDCFHRGNDKPSEWENAYEGGVMPTNWLYNRIKYGKFTDRIV